MVVTLFDLDHTLLPLDTNQAWVSFLCEVGALDGKVYLPAAAAMKSRYLAGGDDPDIAFCEFFIATLTAFSAPDLLALRARFVTQVVRPAIGAPATALIAAHRAQGDVMAIVTATNDFITSPIAAAFGIEHLIATQCEMRNGKLTGKVTGTPSMRSGKVMRVDAWLRAKPTPDLDSRAAVSTLRFYSDSINDRALLEEADEAIAVNPDAGLAALAKQRGWPVIALY